MRKLVLVQSSIEGEILESKALQLRSLVSLKFNHSPLAGKKRVAKDAARFVYSSIQQQTFVAEKMWLHDVKTHAWFDQIDEAEKSQ